MKLLQNKFAPLLLAVIIAALWSTNWEPAPSPQVPGSGDADQILADAFANRTSDLWVTGRGRVDRTLSDDNQGSRHQRFILELSSGQSILIAHNIDLAPRVPDIAANDDVEFRGVYEWNERGGVVHWTHHDPDGRVEGGWLRHNGIAYR